MDENQAKRVIALNKDIAATRDALSKFEWDISELEKSRKSRDWNVRQSWKLRIMLDENPAYATRRFVDVIVPLGVVQQQLVDRRNLAQRQLLKLMDELEAI